MSVKIIDNSEKVKSQIDQNKKRALTAMGLKGVEVIVNQMQSGYGRPIRITGDLQRDVNSQVENSKADTVDVGNSLDYAKFVHEGTSKMAGRPYITDAIMKSKDNLQDVAKAYLKQGF